MKVTLESGQFGWDYLLVADDGQDLLIQTDWDYPAVASNLGWAPRLIQICPECKDALRVDRDCVLAACHACGDRILRVCDHDGTDGTVACPDCGIGAGAFIGAAQEFLDDHIGESFDDPGYFAERTVAP